MPTNFSTPRQPRLLHRQRAHHHVLVEEAAGRLAVRADAADDGRQMDDDVRPDVAEQPRDVGLARQVVLRLARDDHVAAAAAFERGDDVAAEKSAAAGDEHALR